MKSFEINEGIRMCKTVLCCSALKKEVQKDTLKCPSWPFKYSGSYKAWNTGLRKHLSLETAQSHSISLIKFEKRTLSVLCIYR